MTWQSNDTSAPQKVPLSGFGRYENPYVNSSGVEFPLNGNVSFAFGGQRLELDFDNATRRTIIATA